MQANAEEPDSVDTPHGGLKPDRVKRIAWRIATKRAGASLKVSENDVRMALAGKDTLHTRCMALSLRELDEPELRAWVTQGLITAEELRRCQALDPRRGPIEQRAEGPQRGEAQK